MKKKKLKRIVEDLLIECGLVDERPKDPEAIHTNWSAKVERQIADLEVRLDDLTKTFQAIINRLNSAVEDSEGEILDLRRHVRDLERLTQVLPGSKERILELEKQIAAVRLEHDRTRARVVDLHKTVDEVLLK